MLIFDEKEYSQDIIRNGYKTKKNQGIERCCLIRYLRYQGKNDADIIKELDRISFDKRQYLKREDVLCIYRKLLDKASDFEFIHDIEVGITEKDREYIINLDKDISFLAYVYLVYYKWAKNIKRYVFKYNNKIYVEYNENDLWKLAKLSSKRVKDRYILDNKLLKIDFIDIRVFKSKTFIHVKENDDIDFFQKLSGVKINHLEEAFKVLQKKVYKNIRWIQCEKCGKAFMAFSPKAKYCEKCKGDVRAEIVSKSAKRTREKKYIVYKHISPSNKVYIGITSQNPTTRWNMGEGYKSQKYFYNAIKKYGWENFEHIIISENLEYKEACKLEKKLIEEENSNNVEYGYNITEGGEGRAVSLAEVYSLDLEARNKKMLNLLNAGESIDKIYETIYLYELAPMLDSNLSFSDKSTLLYFYVYYIFMRDLGKILEDGYVYVYKNISIYNILKKFLDKNPKCIQYKILDGEYFFKVDLGIAVEQDDRKVYILSLKESSNKIIKNFGLM